MKTYLFTLLQFCALCIYSQNLIPNGGFETYKKCPDNLAQLKYATAWQDQNGGNGDYFNTCAKNNVSATANNRPTAHTGSGYAGFCSIKQQYFEFIQTKLASPLNPDKLYCLTLFVCKAPERVVTIDELAFLFSKTENKTTTIGFYEDKLIRDNNLIIGKLPANLKNEWVKICMTYKPKAAEQFLTIGLNKLKVISNEDIQQPYLYVDDISLTELKEGEKCSCEQAH